MNPADVAHKAIDFCIAKMNPVSCRLPHELPLLVLTEVTPFTEGVIEIGVVGDLLKPPRQIIL